VSVRRKRVDSVRIPLLLHIMHADMYTRTQKCIRTWSHARVHSRRDIYGQTSACIHRFNLVAYEIAIPVGVADDDMIARVTALGQSQYLDDKIQVCAEHVL
jgi:hypothetical protein